MIDFTKDGRETENKGNDKLMSTAMLAEDEGEFSLRPKTL